MPDESDVLLVSLLSFSSIESTRRSAVDDFLLKLELMDLPLGGLGSISWLRLRKALVLVDLQLLIGGGGGGGGGGEGGGDEDTVRLGISLDDRFHQE